MKIRTEWVKKICQECGDSFQAQGKSAASRRRFCGAKCAGRWNFKAHPHKGSIGELVVCVDLLRRGWEAFRAVSATASCDIIALRGGRMLRIQVTALRGKTHAPHSIEHYDVLALYTQDGTVSYNPELPQ